MRPFTVTCHRSIAQWMTRPNVSAMSASACAKRDMCCGSSGFIRSTGSASRSICCGSRTGARAHLLLQILVHDLDEFFGGESLRSIASCLLIDHVFAYVIFD